MPWQMKFLVLVLGLQGGEIVRMGVVVALVDS
jgi:hypothetical protein